MQTAVTEPGAELFRTDPSEPLAFFHRPAAAPAHLGGVDAFRFEYASRGDRVPGRLLLPSGATRPAPLVLLQHGAGGSKDAPYLDAACGPWVRGGAAVASIDFPLHGERASTKLTAHVLAALGGSTKPGDVSLWIEFVRQSVHDLRRALDALALHPGVDASRVVYAAFSMGTILGTPFVASDARPRAAALAIGGGGFGPPAVDPAHHVARIAPRPLLFVQAERDERVPRASAEALHRAAAEPKEILWFDCTHSALPGVALKAMWRFLRPHLALDA
jgi:dienelactone hydrolase